MKKLVLTLGLTLSLASSAFAKTPPEVLKPYKEYRAALESGDKDKTYKSAKKAWELAEKLMGDTKITGDLAANFAISMPSASKYSFKEYEQRMKAHKRAIELASFYDKAEAIDIELDRHIKRIETGLTLATNRNGKTKEGGRPTYFNEMEKALDKYERRGSTFEGDMEVLRVRYYELRKQPEKGIESAKRAISIYENRTDMYSTHYPIMLKLFKGNVLKDAGDPIKAVLEYQDVMQNLEGNLPAEHTFIKTAFTEWVKTRMDIVDSGQFEEAEKAGLCRCWPFEEYSEDVIPLERVPPVMPRSAKRSGHVNVIFDVNQQGKPINLRVLNSTEKLFEKPALAAVKKWQYSPIGHGETEAKLRKDVSTKISFRLTNSSGKIIPEKGEAL